jgi:hypothetical protein
MHYLKKYVGTYRVKADYDLETKDFPRLEDGSLDPSFDDLYIQCKNDVKIRHALSNMLWCHIPSKPRGLNVLRKIYEDKVSKKLPNEKGKYFESLCSKLVEEGVLIGAEVLDYEVYFIFKTDMVDYIANLVGASSYGASIQPFSTKNLPREPYKIPDKDLKLYKNAIKNLPVRTVEINGKAREMVDGFLIKELNKEFDEIIIKSQPKKFDIAQDRKKKGLKGKEYIHSFGDDMWNKYCEFLESSVKDGGG